MDFFRFELFELFLNSSTTEIVLVTLPSTAVETVTARCTSRCATARGHRLNTSIVLAAVHGLSGLFRAVSAVEPSFSRPLPLPLPAPLSPSLISNLASVDVKQYGQGHDDVDLVIVTLFCIPVGTAIAWCGGRCAMPDGHCLNIWLFLRRSTAALVFRVGVCFEVSLFSPPFPTRPRP